MGNIFKIIREMFNCLKPGEKAACIGLILLWIALAIYIINWTNSLFR